MGNDRLADADMTGSRLAKLRPTMLLGAVATMLAAVPLVHMSSPLPLGRGVMAAATSSLTATFVDTDDWGTGYIGEYQVTDVGAATVAAWQLTFLLPAESGLVSSWNGVASVSGNTVSVTNAAWDGTLSPGATVDFGFQVAYTGAFAPPSSCTIDRSPCEGGTATGPVSTTVPVSTTTTTTVGPSPPSQRGPTEFVPYIDMTLQQQNLAAISSASGIRAFTLAFVVSDGDCTPAWGGVDVVGSPGDYVKNAIAAFRQAGGSVILSFGGEAGTELAESCSSATALEAAYQKVVDTYGVYDVDFDIEGAAVSDVASINMRSAALALLQRDEASLGHQVEVSLTLPVLPSGLPSAEMAVVRSSVAAGVHLSIVNPMTMDYGGAVTDPDQMGTYAIDAAQRVEQQLASIYPTDSASQLWAMVGITPLIGQNDVSNEVFSLSDASQLAQFAARAGVGRVSMWSVTRDQQCAQGVIDYDSPTCSGVLQTSWTFSHTLEAG